MVSSGPQRFTESKTNRIGEISRQVDWSDSPVDLKGKWPKLCAVINPSEDPKFHKFDLEEKTSKEAVVHFENSRGIVHRFRGEDGQEACLYRDTATAFELGGAGTATADCEEVFDICTSIKEEQQLDVISRETKRIVSWETTEVFTVPKLTKEKAHWICEVGHCISAKELTQRTNTELQNRPQFHRRRLEKRNFSKSI